ncbi:MAG: FG-GAP-like repeat-containing protein, partial [Planctomycetota bacterium]
NGNGVEDDLDLSERSVEQSYRSTYAVGVTPRNMLSVDVDRDGELDLVVSERHSDAFVVLRGLQVDPEGVRGYADPVRFPLVNPAWIAAADFDGDGEQDIVAVSNLAGVARIRRGREGVSFHDEIVEVPLSSSGWSYVLAEDFDEDGFVDLIFANRFSPDIGLFYGRGDLSFVEGEATEVPSLGIVHRIVVEDLDLDGHKDLVVVGEAVDDPAAVGSGFVWISGTEGGSLGDFHPFRHGQDVSRAVATDLQSDGFPDLVWIENEQSAPSGGTQFRLRRLNFRGDYLFPGTLVDEVSSLPTALSANDLTGDGLPEVVLGFESGEVQIYLNNGDAGLQRLPGWAQPNAANPILDLVVGVHGDHSEIAVLSAVNDNSPGEVTEIALEGAPPSRDTNGNGIPDECEGDCDQNGVLDHEDIASGVAPDCNGNGIPDACDLFIPSEVFSEASFTETPSHPGEIIAVDIDGDALLDIVTTLPTLDGTDPSYRNRGDGTFLQPEEQSNLFAASFLAADLDSDGFIDLALGSSSKVTIAFGGPNQQFTTDLVSVGARSRLRGLEARDFDRDGQMDLITVGTSKGVGCPADLLLLKGRGDRSFEPFWLQAVTESPGQCGFEDIVSADFDGDGFDDVVAYGNRSARVLWNEPEGTFSEGQVVGRREESPFIRKVQPVDYDGDGDVDLVVVRSDVVDLWENEGAREFKLARELIVELVQDAWVGDIDADGRPDVLTVSYQRSVLELFRGTSDGGFAFPKASSTKPSPTSVLVEDFDRGGRLDVVITQERNGRNPPGFSFFTVESLLSVDTDGDGNLDECEIADGAADCNDDKIPDEDQGLTDINDDDIPDECQARDFAFVLEGPDQLGGAPGTFAGGAYTASIETWIEGLDEGVQGWSMSVGLEGPGAVVWATTDGTAGANVDQGGLRYAGFESTQVVEGDGTGAISAVVLSYVRPNTLPMDERVPVLRLGVEWLMPDPSAEIDARVAFIDGLRGTGQPVDNLLTQSGKTRVPFKLSQPVRLSSLDRAFLRGDANADGNVDISDSIFVLSYLFLGGSQPPCLSAADADDSGALDLTDGAFINLFLFLGGTTPPAPGPFDCGMDPTNDLGCFWSGSCS